MQRCARRYVDFGHDPLNLGIEIGAFLSTGIGARHNRVTRFRMKCYPSHVDIVVGIQQLFIARANVTDNECAFITAKV